MGFGVDTFSLHHAGMSGHRWCEIFETRFYAPCAMPHLWSWELDQELANADEGLNLSPEFHVREAKNNPRKRPNMMMHDLELVIEAAGDRLRKLPQGKSSTAAPKTP